MRRLITLVCYLGIIGLLQGLARYLVRNRTGIRYELMNLGNWPVVYGLIFCAVAFLFGLPDLQETLARTIVLSILSCAASATVFSIINTIWGPSLLPRYLTVAAPFAIAPWLILCGLLSRRGWNREAAKERVLVIASGSEIEQVRREMTGRPERPCVFVGSVEMSRLTSNPERRATFGQALYVCEPGKVLEEAGLHQASLLVLSEEAQRFPQVVKEAAQLHESGTRVRSLTAFYDEWLGKLPISELDRMQLMFDLSDVHPTVYARLKRTVDVIAAVAILAVLALLLPFILIGNLIGNRGPLFFRQRRIGQYGEEFDILKFRSMTPNASGQGEWTIVGDARISSFGGLLRRTHLDELPQAMNILKGEISLIGPRPEQVHYVRQLEQSIPHYGFRHTVRPGITGWAQVKYPYGASVRDAEEKLEYDLHYLRHHSLFTDLRITSRTLRGIFFKSGR